MEFLILGYVACCVAAFFLFCKASLYSFDVGYGDALFFMFLSLMGPVSLILSAIIYGIEWAQSSGFGGGSDKVFWRRK